MAANNKWSSRLPFIGLGILVLFLIIIGVSIASNNDESYGWLITGMILVLLCIFMWLKPWKWDVWSKIKTSASTTSSTATPTSKPASPPPSVMKITWTSISILFGIAFAFWLLLIFMSTCRDFQSPPIDRNAPAVQVPIPALPYGDHFLRVGEARLYSHENKPEYFYPAYNGTTVHFRICKYKNRDMYHDFSITKNGDGSIPDQNCTSYFNNLSSDYGYYTVEVLDNDAMVTYSDHPIN